HPLIITRTQDGVKRKHSNLTSGGWSCVGSPDRERSPEKGGVPCATCDSSCLRRRSSPSRCCSPKARSGRGRRCSGPPRRPGVDKVRYNWQQRTADPPHDAASGVAGDRRGKDCSVPVLTEAARLLDSGPLRLLRAGGGVCYSRARVKRERAARSSGRGPAGEEHELAARPVESVSHLVDDVPLGS